MTLRSASVVLVTWDGAGNLPPQRALVRSLTAAGHTVRVLGHDSVREAFGRDGAAHLPVPGLRPYDALTPIPPEEEMPFVVEHIWYARAFGAELLATIDRLGPDLVLVDICLTYALVAALRSGVQTVVLGHFPYSLLLGPFAPLTAARLEEANAYATELGLVPFASHQMLIESAPVVLVPTYRPFETIGAFAPKVAHIGPFGDAGVKQRSKELARSLADHPGLDHGVGLVEGLLHA